MEQILLVNDLSKETYFYMISQKKLLLLYDLSKETVTFIWSLKRNCYFYNKNLLSNGSLTYCWNFGRRYISTKNVNNLPRLHNTNVNRSIKRKWFHIKKKSGWYPGETMTDADYKDDLVLLIPAQTKALLVSLDQAAGGIMLYIDKNKTKFMDS